MQTSRSEDRSERFAALVPGGGREPPLVGIEQEAIIWAGDRRLDFRRVIHRLGLDGGGLDPGDPHAHRLRSGAVITCDGPEAEFATPPCRLAPGFVAEISAWVAEAAGALRTRLPEQQAPEAWSTHFSISTPALLAPRVARLFARTFGPALMLLAEGNDSLGLLVRPRPGRLELGTDYVSGASLDAAVAMAAGGALACRSVVAGDTDPQLLPPPLRLTLEPAVERYGWYVDRKAFGVDLYRGGRRARLRQADGGRVTAQEHLELAWKAARAALEPWVEPDDLVAADQRVTGMQPLPGESRRTRALPFTHDTAMSSAFGDLLNPRARPGFDVAPVVATWDLTVFALAGRRTVYASVPRSVLPAFLQQLESGRLDVVVNGFLAAPSSGRVLERRCDALRPGLWDGLGPRQALVAPELDVNGVPTAMVEPAGGSGSTTTGVGSTTTRGGSTTVTGPATVTRPGKRKPPVEEPPKRTSWMMFAFGGLVLVILLILLLLALAGGGDEQPAGDTEPPGETTPSVEEPTTGTESATDEPTVTDATGDVMVCLSGTPADRPATDIVGVSSDGDGVEVQMAGDVTEALRTSFSYAVEILVRYGGDAGGTIRRLLYQVHDGEQTIGEVDPETGQPVPAGAEVTADGGTVTVENLGDGPGPFDAVQVNAFTQPNEGDAILCDTVQATAEQLIRAR